MRRRAEPNTVPIELIRKQQSAHAAFALAITSSGLDDQEICDALGVDAGYLSRMKKGAATLQSDLIAPFCLMVGNRIYPEWIAYQLGCTLVQIESESQREARELREQLAKERELRRHAEDMLTRRAT